MPNTARGASIGIPQVIKTPGKFFDLARFIREEVLGKPVAERYDNYEGFVEALIDWILEPPRETTAH